MQKNKILVIAAVVAAVILVAAGITVAVVLSGGYLDSMKDYNFTSDKTYNGVEIVEDDGLFYLTRNGKKLSRTGYTSLEDVNCNYDGYSKQQLLESGDFEIYDYFLATKPESTGYVLVNTEGDEIAIEGENLYRFRIALPYVCFRDSVTGEVGAISLDALDSELSANAGEEISVNMFDDMYFHKLNNGGVKYNYLVAMSEDAAINAPSYTYFNAEGEKLFVSARERAEEYNIYNEDDRQIRYFVTGEGNLYGLDGTLIAGSVANILTEHDCLVALCAPKDDALSAEANALKMYYQVVSWKVQYSIDNTKYDLDTINGAGNLIWLSTRKDGVATNEYRIFNLVTGDTADIYSDIATVDNGLVRGTADGKYVYLDAETGKVLCQSKYDDMRWFANGILTSASEYAEKVASLTERLPVAYMHLVKAGQEEKTMTLTFGQSIETVVVNDELSAYKVTTLDSWTNQSYSVSTEHLYFPFSTVTAKTASYDKIDVLEVFSKAAPIAVGTDLAGGKYDVIDLANGEVIKTVNAAGADMAKTFIYHMDTYVLAADNSKKESAVDVAVLAIVKTDDNEDISTHEWIALSRNTAMTEKGDYRMTPVTLTELGNDLIVENIVGSDVGENGELSFTKYLRVGTSMSSTDIYELSDELILEKICTIPYYVIDTIEWGDALDEVYFLVSNNADKYGLYDTNGTQILAPVYDRDCINAFGEYITVYSRNAHGMFKYNAEKGKVKQVLDFEYEDIIHISDDAFIVQVGYDWYLYEGDDQVKKDPLIDEYKQGTNISINEDTDAIEYSEYFTVNINGKFYIHRGEAKEVIYTEFVAEKTYSQGFVRSGVSVVNFRDTDGKIIETKVLYPTVKGAFEFTMPEGVWYETGVKELQDVDTAVTEIELEAAAGGVINVYKAHSASLGITG